MDEITFEDILLHYEGKLKEAADEVETLKNTLRKCLDSAESGWTGAAGDAFRRKLEDVQEELKKADAELSEALLKLTAIGDELAEGAVLLVSEV